MIILSYNEMFCYKHHESYTIYLKSLKFLHTLYELNNTKTAISRMMWRFLILIFI